MMHGFLSADRQAPRERQMIESCMHLYNDTNGVLPVKLADPIQHVLPYALQACRKCRLNVDDAPLPIGTFGICCSYYRSKQMSTSIANEIRVQAIKPPISRETRVHS